MKAIFAISLLLFSASAFTDDFVTTWKTNNHGLSNNTSIMIPMIGGPYDVDWDNDGVFDELGITGTATHDYMVVGTYTVRIRGSFDSIQFDYSSDREKIISLDQWGTNRWKSMENAFASALWLKTPATDTPDFSAVTDMSGMFSSAFHANPATSGWDTSSVTDVSGMFYSARAAIPDTSGWDMSSVKNLRGMFSRAESANPDTSDWDTSSVTDMSGMFSRAFLANPDTSGWNTSSVTDMSDMFLGANSANPDTSDWDTSSVTDMSGVFSSATLANPDISGWDTSSVTDMSGMFGGATSANPDTSGWDTSSVTNMYRMFSGATSANPDTSGWDTSGVERIAWMFASTTSANPDTSGWDTSSVTDMNGMFRSATSANPDVSQWDTSAVKRMDEMFRGASSANPDTSRWDTSSVWTMVWMFAFATSANPDTSGWDTSRVVNMAFLFRAATAANPDTSGWDTSSVRNMREMFIGATAANPDVGNWDTSSVETMKNMFAGAASANPDVSGWDTSSVTDMDRMFYLATSFNQNLGSWNITALEDAFGMFDGITLSPTNYESLLVGWGAQKLKRRVGFGGGNSTYCSAEAKAAKERMIRFSWNIRDGGQACPPDRPTGVRATDGDFPNRVQITFNPVDGATKYRVFRCPDNGYTCGLPIGYPTAPNFIDTRGNSEQVYYYRVRACVANRCGKFSVADTGFRTPAPNRPTGIRATDGTFEDRVQVTFDPVERATIYRVFRCPDRGNTCGLPIGFPKTGTFDDRKGIPGTVYYYRVRACTATTCGKFSVANAGHRAVIPTTESDENMVIMNDVPNGSLNDVPIPSLSDVGRWLLILMTLGFGLILVNRQCARSR